MSLIEAIWGPRRIDEGLSEVLWHATPLRNAGSILREGELKGLPLDGSVEESENSGAHFWKIVEEMMIMRGLSENHLSAIDLFRLPAA